MLLLFISHTFSKRYKPNDPIHVYSNKISPYHNPFETYDYFSLPFCKCKNPSFQRTTLGDGFLGNKMTQTAITLNYTENIIDKTVCIVTFHGKNLTALKEAIDNEYYYQLFVDKLPVWGYVGFKTHSNLYYIYTRKHFSIFYNNDRVIQVNLSTESPFLFLNESDANTHSISKPIQAKFSYSVSWEPTTMGKEFRRRRSDDRKFFQNSVHYYQILRSVFLILFIVAFTVLMIIRAVSNDVSKIRHEAEIGSFELDFRQEKGWKMIHADVFRTPSHFGLLSILISIGAHITTAFILFLIISLFFGSYFGRSTRTNIIFSCYAISSILGGYFAGGFYKRWGGRNWRLQLLICSLTVPILFIFIELILSLFALIKGSTQAANIFSIFSLILIVILAIVPLTFFGGLIGRHHFIFSDESFKVGTIRRTIPPMPFYLKSPILELITGVCI